MICPSTFRISFWFTIFFHSDECKILILINLCSDKVFENIKRRPFVSVFKPKGLWSRIKYSHRNRGKSTVISFYALSFWKWPLTPHNDFLISYLWIIILMGCPGIFRCPYYRDLSLLLLYDCRIQRPSWLGPSCRRWCSYVGRHNWDHFIDWRILFLRGGTYW